MTDRRRERLREAAYRRQLNLTVVLENVHDQHNIGAVLRSCDAVGIAEIYVLHNEVGIQHKNLTLGKRTSAGTRRWVDVHYFTDTDACFDKIRTRYDRVYATHMAEDAVGLYELDLTEAVALVFGNEHDGISQPALDRCDGNFLVPQMGMVQSLNISVACAVTVYEAFRQRSAKDFYGDGNPASAADREALFQEYMERHEARVVRKKIPPSPDDPRGLLS
ncbi:MAG: RNA methyltransferase [Lewinella sp.]|nr:RNA methyltransferase [Lewinella sp.]